jgi:diguanylate cyclase (GGDEF)-like protein
MPTSTQGYRAWREQLGPAHVTYALLGVWIFLQPLLPSAQGGVLALLPTAISLLLFAAAGARLQQFINALRATSFTDPLTGLANRRAFEWRMTAELQAMKRHHQPLAVLMLDVDLLKVINDRQGHAGGDRALRMTADSIRMMSRAADLPTRLGGDEFAVLAPQTSAEEAAVLARRIQETLRALSEEKGSGAHFSASAGIASTEMAVCQDRVSLMEMADAALYEAKQRGRDQLGIGRTSSEARARFQQSQALG